MAIRCDDCKYIFYKKFTICPHCGGPIDVDTADEEQLLSSGYRVAPGQKKPAGSSAEAEDPNNVISQLQKDFLQAQKNKPAGGTAVVNPAPVIISNPVNNPAPVPPVSPPPASPAPKAPTGTDFFATLGGNQENMNNVFVVERPNNNNTQTAGGNDIEEYNNTLRNIERQQRQANRRARWDDFMYSLRSIPMGTILRFLLVIGLIFLLIGLWNARFVIINSIFDFFMSLLPTVIIIWLLWTIITSFFR